MAYPTNLDNLATNRADGTVNATTHAADHNAHAAAVNALETKVGVGASTPTTAGDVLTVTAAGAAAWATPTVVNVKLAPYSAAGDDATNDAVALQAAFDYGAANKIPVYLPKGTYRHTAALNLSSNLTIHGAGMGLSVLKYAPAALGRGAVEQADFSVALANVTLRDFTVDRTATHAAHGIYVGNLNGFWMQRVAVVGPPGSFVADATPSVAVCVSSFGGAAPYASKNVDITDCYFYRTSDGGVQFGNVDGATVKGCLFENCYREIVGLEPYAAGVVQNVVVAGNHVVMGVDESIGSDGAILLTTSSQTTPTDETQLRNIAITGNVVTASGLSTGTAGPGINVNGGFQVSVVGNTVERAGGTGITVGGPTGYPAKRITVVGNVVKDCAQKTSSAGILARNCSASIFADNIVVGALHTYAIQEDATCADNQWRNHYVETGATGAYTFANGTVATGLKVATAAPIDIHGRRAAHARLALTSGVTLVAATIHDVCSLASATGVTTDYGGLLLVEARNAEGDGSVNTATYLLLVGKSALGNHCQSISTIGLTAGSGASWPSFTWTVDDTTNKLRATPVGSTAGTFYFYVSTTGNLVVAP